MAWVDSLSANVVSFIKKIFGKVILTQGEDILNLLIKIKNQIQFLLMRGKSTSERKSCDIYYKIIYSNLHIQKVIGDGQVGLKNSCLVVEERKLNDTLNGLYRFILKETEITKQKKKKSRPIRHLPKDFDVRNKELFNVLDFLNKCEIPPENVSNDQGVQERKNKNKDGILTRLQKMLVELKNYTCGTIEDSSELSCRLDKKSQLHVNIDGIPTILQIICFEFQNENRKIVMSKEDKLEGIVAKVVWTKKDVTASNSESL